LPQHVVEAYGRLVWINSGLIKIVNIYGNLTYVEPEINLECYVTMMIKLL